MLGTREVGHAGTLDPMATGMLVIAIGEATKLVPYLTAADKSYEATIALGVETDTLDAEGTVTGESDISSDLARALADASGCTSHAIVCEALAVERARTLQVPPAVSAIKVDGERAHDRVRRGEVVLLAPRAVDARFLEVTGAGVTPKPWLSVKLETSKGYYVRAFARDLAASMGTLAHLTALRRLRSGAFDEREACLLPDERDKNARAFLAERLIALASAAGRCLPTRTLTAEGVVRARQGKLLAPEAMTSDAPAGIAAWLDENGRLIAIGARADDGTARVIRGFREDA
jgi:tRNA pseudouridine55 synthase